MGTRNAIQFGRRRGSVQVHPGALSPFFDLMIAGPTLGQVGAGALYGMKHESVSVTRASTKTCVKADGSVVSVGSGKPCVEPKGLLIEPAHTNLCLRSQEFDNAAWAKNSGGASSAPVVTANAAVAPDGTMTADRVDFSAVNASGDICDIAQAPGTTNGTYTFSVWIRGVSGSGTINLFFYDGSLVTPVVVNYTTTWQRYSITKAVATNAGGAFLIGGHHAWPADIAAQSVYLWGAQFETGSIAHSYMPTTSASATCNQDVPTAVASLPKATGSVDFDFTPQWATATAPNNAALIDTRNALQNNSGILIRVDTGNTVLFIVSDSTGTFYTLSSGAVLSFTAGQKYHFRAEWGGGRVACYRDGTAIQTAATGKPMPDMPGTLCLGVGFDGTAPCGGWIKNLHFGSGI
jgi:hypothetical protein